MARAELERRVGQVLENNRIDDKFTSPSKGHYPEVFRWDLTNVVKTYVSRGELNRAETELQTLLEGMDSKTGFIPGRRRIGKKDLKDIESLTFNKENRKRNESSYAQPTLEAEAAWAIYKAKGEKGKAFLESIYGEVEEEKTSGLRGVFEYFRRYRENGNGSRLVGIIHPNETGRDSDPSLRKGAVHMPGSSWAAPLANTALDILTTARINARAKLREWDPKKMKEEVYWVNDVMFNSIYVNNLFYMADISDVVGKHTKAEDYKKWAQQVEKEIIEKMWNPDDGFFYNLDKDEKQIAIASISGLFPLLLPNIPKEQVEKLLEAMESRDKFNTEYPIPSLPADSPYYDPDYSQKRLWRGPVLMIANHELSEEGLVKQMIRFEKEDISLYRRLKNRLINIIGKSEELLTISDLRELYSSRTGKGFRIKDFTWSASGLYFDKARDLFSRPKKNQSEGLKVS